MLEKFSKEHHFNLTYMTPLGLQSESSRKSKYNLVDIINIESIYILTKLINGDILNRVRPAMMYHSLL